MEAAHRQAPTAQTESLFKFMVIIGCGDGYRKPGRETPGMGSNIKWKNLLVNKRRNGPTPDL